MKVENSTIYKWVQFIFTLFLLIGLYLTSLHNYLLFHSLAEIFSIIVACGIFMVAWNSRKFMDNNYLLFVGIAYLFIALIDLIHTLAYTGMPIFPGYGTNLPAQFWIGGRYLESLSLFLAPVFLSRQVRAGLIFLIYLIVFSLILFSIFNGIFPTCYIEGIGLTPFKKISEYIIGLILIGAIIHLYKNRQEFDANVLRLLIISIVFTIVAELAFTFYISAYGISNLIGHYLKIASFILIYKALIDVGLTKPFDLLFRDLKKNSEYHQSILYTAMDGFWLTDYQGKLLEVNDSYCQMSGYSQTELLNMHISDVEAIETATDTASRIHDLKKHGEGRFQSKHKRKNGSIFDVEISVQYRNEEDGRFVCFLQDITARKLSEEKLQKSELRFLQMFEQSVTSTCFYNPEGTIIKVNKEFCKMFGVEEKEILNSGYNVFKDQNMVDTGALLSLKEIFENKKTKSWEIDFNIDKASESTKTATSKSGKLFLEVFGYPVLDSNGKIEFIVLQHYDITERKRTEQALKNNQNFLNSVIDQSPFAIWISDEKGTIIKCNAALEKLLNITDEQLIGKYNVFEDEVA
ncbi:MAG: PAS domain S-box protein, partial [Bacteroidetes bacterium]|nr:PAS domain S-box protein [Bacteroidota bacterium]